MLARNFRAQRLDCRKLCTSKAQLIPHVDEVRKVLRSLDSDIRPAPDGKYEVKVCNLCPKANKSNADNLWKLLINRDGSYHCYRCAEHGSFKSLKTRLMAPVDSNVNIKTRTGFNYAAGHNQGAGNHGSGSCGAGGLSAGTRNASAGDGFDENMFPSHSHSLATLAQDGQGKGQDSGASFAPMDQNLAHSYTKNLFGIPEDPDVPPSLNKISLSHSGPLPSIPLYLRAKAVRDYLTKERKLSLTVCERYGVGVAVQQFPSAVTGQWEDNTCVTFPWIEFTATAAGEKSHAIRRIKYRSLDTKGKQRILPKGGAWGFFGWHLVSEAQSSAGTVTASASRAGGNDGSSSSSSSSGSETMSNSSEGERTENAIIITEGEYDALAVAQAISDYRPSCVSQMWVQRTPVVSLPNGCNSLPVELIMKLEKFSKIYLWLDNDSSGIAASANFTRKLGIHRCFLVKPLENCVIQPKDANDIIRYSDPDRVESASVSDESSTSIIGREFTPKKPGRPRKKSSASSSPPGSKTGINDRSATGGVSREQYMRNVELMMEMLHQAQPVRHDRVVSFSDIKHDVLRSLVRGSMTEYEGTLCTSLPTINDITKGFRRGELIVFSGPTGSGKTTLLSQMSVDFASQGIPTLWGSFEIQNVRLAQKMLHQYNSSLLRQNHEDVVISASDLDTPRKKRRPRALTAENFKMVADDFEQLPFQFLNFHGGSSLGDVLDAMDYAVYKHDIQHIILDNLQFMMPGGTGAEAFKGGGSSAVLGKSSFNNNFNTSYSDISRYTAGLDVGTKFSPISKFETQDLAIQAFRKFATINNVNVILVIHPRKEDDNLPLGISSIFGSAKATQEADMVMILQRLAEEETAGQMLPVGARGQPQPQPKVQAVGSFQVKSGGGSTLGTAVAPVQRNIYVDVKKNRYDGTLGKVKLNFSPHDMSFSELQKEP